MDIKYRITYADHIKQILWEDVRSYTWLELCSIMTNHQLGLKDGPCFTPAVFRGSQRKKAYAQQIDLLALDCDSGEDINHIRSALKQAGLGGIIYSTHSHMANADNPIPKFRVILPLQNPWRVDQFEDQREANDIWAKAILGVSSLLGLQHDQNCKDTSRAYYFPRHSEGAEYVAEIIPGYPCNIDWNKYRDAPSNCSNDLKHNLTPYLLTALEGELSELQSAQKGGRNHQLNKSAFALGRFMDQGLTLAIIENNLTPIALSIGLGRGETEKTIRSATKAGLEEERIKIQSGFQRINIQQSNTPQSHSSEIQLLCVDDVEMVPINWLWKDRIALGKLTVIAGQPGLGKSQITAMLCAHITSGIPFPDGGQPSIGDVVVLSAEDDVADTIKPRLIAAGANLKRCHFVDGVKTMVNGTNAIRMFDLTSDIKALESIVKANANIKLLIIDPVSAYQGQTDSHGNAEMRSLLAPYSKLAADYNLAIVLVTHFNKSKSQEHLERVIGSIGLIAAARAGYAVIKDLTDDQVRYFIPIKNNVGNDRDGFSYNIEGVALENGIETSRVCWHEGIVQAQPILSPEADKKSTQTSEAAVFLQDLLCSGPMLAKDIFDNGDGAGYTKSSLRRAKDRIKAKKRKLDFNKGWVWFLSHHEHLVTEMMKPS